MVLPYTEKIGPHLFEVRPKNSGGARVLCRTCNQRTTTRTDAATEEWIVTHSET